MHTFIRVINSQFLCKFHNAIEHSVAPDDLTLSRGSAICEFALQSTWTQWTIMRHRNSIHSYDIIAEIKPKKQQQTIMMQIKRSRRFFVSRSPTRTNIYISLLFLFLLYYFFSSNLRVFSASSSSSSFQGSSLPSSCSSLLYRIPTILFVYFFHCSLNFII